MSTQPSVIATRDRPATHADRLKLQGHKLMYHPERVARWLRGDPTWPIYVDVCPTSLCNHHCSMCFYNHIASRRASMPREMMLRLPHELAEVGVLSLVYAGDGEPLVHPDTPQAVAEARRSGIDVGLSTNGALLTDESIEGLARDLTWIRFSINGSDPASYRRVHGAGPDDFDRVLDNIGRMASARDACGSAVTIGVQFIVLPDNHDRIGDLVQRVRQAGADYFVVKFCYVHPDSEQGTNDPLSQRARQYDRLVPMLDLADETFNVTLRDPTVPCEGRDYTACYGLDFIGYIHADGRVYTCLSYHDDESLSLGSLHDKTFGQVWDGPKRWEVKRRLTRLDKRTCQPACRHHEINKYLWALKHPGSHVNFI